MKNIFKKLTLNYYLSFIIILIISASFLFLKYEINYNLSNSLPQKLFLIKKGKLPDRYDYVLFSKDNKFYNYNFVKQVIGIEFDEIKQIDRNLWINTKVNPFVIAAGYAKELSLNNEKLNIINVQRIPRGHYYIYAPHKDSLDSRYQEIGLINKDNIIGTAYPISFMDIFIFIITLIILTIFIRFILKNFIISRFLIILFLFLTYFSQNVFAKDLGVHGQIYDIAEEDLKQYIYNKLTSLEESGELKKIQKEQQQQVIKRAKRPKAVTGLVNATKNREFIYDASVIAKNNIYDHSGNIIVQKGTRVNPLDYKKFSQTLLFIDGDNPLHIDWSMNQKQDSNTLIILTKGNVIDLMSKHQTRLYFDQNGYLTKTFGIKALPAKVFQDKDVIKVREEALI